MEHVGRDRRAVDDRGVVADIWDGGSELLEGRTFVHRVMCCWAGGGKSVCYPVGSYLTRVALVGIQSVTAKLGDIGRLRQPGRR